MVFHWRMAENGTFLPNVSACCVYLESCLLTRVFLKKVVLPISFAETTEWWHVEYLFCYYKWYSNHKAPVLAHGKQWFCSGICVGTACKQWRCLLKSSSARLSSMVVMDTKIKSVLRLYSKFSFPQFQNNELTIFLSLLGDGLNYGCCNATSMFSLFLGAKGRWLCYKWEKDTLA